jgi:hypothetical protein
MDSIHAIPNWKISEKGPVSKALLALGLLHFSQAAQYVQALPYGYNTGETHSLTALQDGFGTCTTKHALIAACAQEHDWPVYKAMGVYIMDNQLVKGISTVLAKLKLAAVPALHCFLTYGPYRFDLTEGNCNGKSAALDSYIYIEAVPPIPDERVVELIYEEGLRRYQAMLPNRYAPELWERAREICAEHLRSLVACPAGVNV